jgi:phosphoglycolate phosphatase-like HAD superfamily hydrolase
MHAILFDIDGTLIDSLGAGMAALHEAFRTEFGVERRDETVAFSGRTDRGINMDYFSRYGIDDTLENWQRFHSAYLRHLSVTLAARAGFVLPGVASLLDSLDRRDDFVVGLLTGNIRDAATAKLNHFGLARYFYFGGFGDYHASRNDVAREALREAERRVNGQGRLDRVWVIGDTPLDVECARAIGARVIAVATGHHPVDELAATQPDLTLRDLSDHEPLWRVWE